MTIETGAEVTKVQRLIIPQTGQVLDLPKEPTNLLAEAFDQIKEMEAELSSLRRRVGEELTKRLDHEAVRTFDAGGWRIEVDAPVRYAWDGEAVRDTLRRLANDGAISENVIDRACKQQWKVSLRELDKIKRVLNETDASKLDACREPSDRARSVRVKYHPEGR